MHLECLLFAAGSNPSALWNEFSPSVQMWGGWGEAVAHSSEWREVLPQPLQSRGWWTLGAPRASAHRWPTSWSEAKASSCFVSLPHPDSSVGQLLLLAHHRGSGDLPEASEFRVKDYRRGARRAGQRALRGSRRDCWGDWAVLQSSCKATVRNGCHGNPDLNTILLK